MGRMIILVILLLVFLLDGSVSKDDAGILQLTHRYSNYEGSSKRNSGRVTKEHLQILMRHDRARRGRFLADGVNFELGGTADPTNGGLYFTQIGLGNPVKQYIVQVDTGSDVLWVNCRPCLGCPRRSELNIPLTIYDPQESSTTSEVSCSDNLCELGTRVSEAGCSENNRCVYTFQYGDGSTSSGYYVRDTMQYTVIGNGGGLTNTTSKVMFGCSQRQTGDLTYSGQAVDGIMGFGQLALSVPNQIASEQKLPKVFSHCLEGETRGGGILVIGGVTANGIVYTDMVPNSTHYNVVLESITVNSNKLPIDAEDFSSTSDQGVIFDSGTTLTYLPGGAYNIFVQAVRDATNASPVRVPGFDTQCFLVSGSIYDTFPKVTLSFAGGATMELTPDNYLMLGGTASGPGGRTNVYCLGWQSSGSSSGPKDSAQLTILGDIVLKNKLVVYDLDKSRIGWVNYNCSSEVKVAGESVTASHLDSGKASGLIVSTALTLITTLFVSFLVY